jgi:hypothetical protein
MSKIKRVATGIATGGLSEVARKAGGGSISEGIGVGQYKGTKQEVDKSSFEQKLTEDENQKALRTQQQAQSKRLEDRATGAAPSLASAQLKAATNRSLAQQLGAAQAQRGGSSAARERNLLKQQGQARREVAESSAVASLQEQQAAEQQLAQQLQAQRATDINLAQADRESAQRLQELLVQENLGVQGLNLSGFQSSQAAKSGLISNLGSGLAAMSDETKKKNIKKDGEKDPSKLMKFAKGFSDQSKQNSSGGDGVGKAALQTAMSKISDEDKKKNIKKEDEEFSSKSFLDALQSYTYEYKDSEKHRPEAGEGRRLSVMAQDLEKAGPVGKSMVINTSEGKVVDYGRGFGAILAAQAELNKRLKDVEKKKK